MAPRRTAAGAAAVKRMREIADANDAEMVGAERAVNAAASDSAVAVALQQRAALYIARGRKAEALADLRRAVALDLRRPRDSAGRCRRACLALAWRVYVTALALAVALLAISALLSLVGGMEGGWVTSRLYNAAERGDLDKVASLLQSGAPAGDPAALAFPLVIAPTTHITTAAGVSDGWWERQGAHLHSRTPLAAATFKGHRAVVVSTSTMYAAMNPQMCSRAAGCTSKSCCGAGRRPTSGARRGRSAGWARSPRSTPRRSWAMRRWWKRCWATVHGPTSTSASPYVTQNASPPTISRPFFAPFAPFLSPFLCAARLPGTDGENGRRVA